jgi:hypothetical protein
MTAALFFSIAIAINYFFGQTQLEGLAAALCNTEL